MPTTTPFNNLITFSRGSNATVTGSNGLIQWAPNNLLTFSEQFDNAAWAKTANVSVTSNAAVAPNGTTTADLMAVSATGAQAIINLNPGATLGLPYTASIYVKRVNSDWFALSNQTFFAYFNLSGAGSVGTVGEGSATITSVGDGWFRIAWAGSTAWSAAVRVRAVTADNNPAVVAGQEYLIWGAQLEIGSTATTYNPTTIKNLLGFSEAFDNAGWTKNRTSIVTGAQANPINGLFNAQKLMEDTQFGEHSANSPSVTAAPAGAIQTASFYAKAAERYKVGVTYPTVGDAQVAWDLRTGQQLGASSGTSFISASITAIGNGWYRCSMTFSRPTAVATGINIHVLPDSATSIVSRSYTGDGNSGVYIYGAQLSDSASLDPYVPTPGAAPSSTAFYGPRFDFDPVTLQPRGLLVEEQRTNLLTYSEQFDNAIWAQGAVTVSANAAVAPNGTTTADRVVPTATTAQHYVSTQFASAASTYTMTVYAKADGYNWIWFNATAAGAPASDLCWFDVANGVTGTAQAGATTSIVSVGNGWYRCVCSWTAFTVGNPVVWIAVASADNQSGGFTGDGTSGVLIWGAQLEAGAFATSYIPTVASTVTRSADVATISGSLFSQWFNQPEGSFVMGYQTIETGLFATTGVALGFDNNLGKSLIYIGGGGDQAASFDGATIVSSGVDTTGNIAKVASAYTSSGRAISANGVAAVTGTVAAGYSTASLLNIARITGGNVLNSRIQSIRFIPARAADFQLQGLST